MDKEKIVSFFYLRIFIFFIVVLIIGSVIFRIYDEIVSSSFKDNSFSLLIVSKDTKYISVDKNSKSAVFFALGDIRNFVKGKRPIEASFALGLPINAIIIDNHPPANLSEFSSSKNILRLIFYPDNVVYKGLDRLDIYKVASVIHQSIKDNSFEARINIFNEGDMKEKVGDKLRDSTITNSTNTIEIDNSTNINGLGSELALILSKKGYNVIAVKTSTEQENSYIAYPGKPDSYISSLVGLTSFPVIKSKKSQAADITIFLGEDLDAMLSP